jgi:hypothetical protein
MRTSLIALAAVVASSAVASTAAARPPDVNGCDYLANTICHYIPPDSAEDVCGILDNTTFVGCEIISIGRQ